MGWDPPEWLPMGCFLERSFDVLEKFSSLSSSRSLSCFFKTNGNKTSVPLYFQYISLPLFVILGTEHTNGDLVGYHMLFFFFFINSVEWNINGREIGKDASVIKKIGFHSACFLIHFGWDIHFWVFSSSILWVCHNTMQMHKQRPCVLNNWLQL